MLTGVALAFVALLWGMPWPWLRTLAVVALLIGAALNMAVWLCHSCFPMEVVMAYGACTWVDHGLSNMFTGAALAFGMLFSLMKVFSKRRIFFFSFLEEGYMSKLAFLSLGNMPTKAALAITACLWKLPWPW